LKTGRAKIGLWAYADFQFKPSVTSSENEWLIFAKVAYNTSSIRWMRK
jgi:hypothetical protein